MGFFFAYFFIVFFFFFAQRPVYVRNNNIMWNNHELFIDKLGIWLLQFWICSFYSRSGSNFHFLIKWGDIGVNSDPGVMWQSLMGVGVLMIKSLICFSSESNQWVATLIEANFRSFTTRRWIFLKCLKSQRSRVKGQICLVCENQERLDRLTFFLFTQSAKCIEIRRFRKRDI